MTVLHMYITKITHSKIGILLLCLLCHLTRQICVLALVIMTTATTCIRVTGQMYARWQNMKCHV